MQITIREPGSALTHFIAMMLAIFAAIPLLVKTGITSGQKNFVALAVFSMSKSAAAIEGRKLVG